MAEDNTALRVKIVWGLYVASLIVGLTGLAGVVLAYLWRRDAADRPLASHFDRQIRTFWIALAISVAGLLLTGIGIGFFVLLAAGVYVAVMGVLGLMKAVDNKAWP